MNRCRIGCLRMADDVPRRRGDEPDCREHYVKAQDMFPAGAGMNRGYDVLHRVASYVPRRRGDEPRSAIVLTMGIRCSPQARG